MTEPMHFDTNLFQIAVMWGVMSLWLRGLSLRVVKDPPPEDAFYMAFLINCTSWNAWVTDKNIRSQSFKQFIITTKHEHLWITLHCLISLLSVSMTAYWMLTHVVPRPQIMEMVHEATSLSMAASSSLTVLICCCRKAGTYPLHLMWHIWPKPVAQ